METKRFNHHPHSPAYHFLLQAGPRLKLLPQVHAYIVVSGSGHTRSLLTKLLNLTCAAGSITYTHKIFLSITNPDSFLFNSLIKSTSKYRFSIHSLYFYTSMLLSNIAPSSYTFTSVVKSCADLSSLMLGKLIHGHVFVNGYGVDVHVQSALVTFYAKSGDLSNARKVFDKMPEQNVVAWNSMISGYEQNGCGKEAITLFERMREVSTGPDSTTLVSVLSACAQERNVFAWTSMVSGYGTHGYGHQAVELFEEMRRVGPCPNSITFVAVLSACAHAGLVKEGRNAFTSMKEQYHLVPGVEHYVCMVDMLGRAGLVEEAYKFIKQQIPKTPSAAAAIWTAMLGACKMHKNMSLGAQVAEHLLAIEPENPGHYVMLSNIYALAGRMDRVEMIRNIMIRKSLKKQVGYSIIEVDQKTYLFSMGDKSHPDTNEIYRYLDELMWRCREAGYTALSKSVMHELEEEEREVALRYHSEKLAIAFGLLKTKSETPIRIVKNLRMCEDCHWAIKYISVVTKREIIVRDKLRFHHFKDGSCSCLDFW
ncbi:pentatricopeptide repeat-containing protein At2g33760 isoform X3 [Euphorbia lathyris]|uniref:pentatricopeptide repeat-containing protein At2g33760 isoform X3 n=1 Tax=Euphorbia lathyris TaxID=212925 RepID=UPI003313554F